MQSPAKGAPRAMPHSTPHTLTIEGRTRAVVTGVEDVDCFNEQLVVLLTGLGQMTITGTGLSVETLNIEDGRLVLTGEVASVEYSGRAQKDGGLFGRLLR